MQTPARPVGGRPRIGIPVRLSSSSDPDPRVGEANALFDYIVDLVRDGGGEPVLLTRRRADLAELDGVVLPGGGDLDPRLYGEEDGGTCYDVNHGPGRAWIWRWPGSPSTPGCRCWASAAGTNS